jgi:hypothetical protein
LGFSDEPPAILIPHGSRRSSELVRRTDVDALIAGSTGVTLTELSSLPAWCALRGDLAIRRSIERVVFEVRTEIANVCQQMADKCGEPPRVTTHDERRPPKSLQAQPFGGMRRRKISADDPPSTWRPGERD